MHTCVNCSRLTSAAAPKLADLSKSMSFTLQAPQCTELDQSRVSCSYALDPCDTASWCLLHGHPLAALHTLSLPSAPVFRSPRVCLHARYGPAAVQPLSAVWPDLERRRLHTLITALHIRCSSRWTPSTPTHSYTHTITCCRPLLTSSGTSCPVGIATGHGRWLG